MGKEEQIEVGDVVRLKSGGPLMTVDKVDDTRSWMKCVWFNEHNDALEAYFYNASVVVEVKNKGNSNE